MTPADFRAALKTIGMRQNQLAEELGVAPITVNRWATGKAEIPKYAELCLKLLLERQTHI
jgi:transcriptional regulator with XRE-family HTH domain